MLLPAASVAVTAKLYEFLVISSGLIANMTSPVKESMEKIPASSLLFVFRLYVTNELSVATAL